MGIARNAGIIGTGSAVPEKVLTNADLEKIVDTSDEWIRNMTGICERRIASEGETTSGFAALAGQRALEAAGMSATDLDMIIVCTVTGDMPFPSTASIVQNAIGAKNVPAFDLSAGCSGWVYGLSVADSMIKSGVLNNVLVIGADLLTRFTNWTDRATCILFGDGAGAAVVSVVEPDKGFLGFELGSDGSGAEVLKIVQGGSKCAVTAEGLIEHKDKIYMEGREVFKFAVKIQGEALEKLMDKVGMHTDDIDMVVPHQANIRIIDSAVKRLGLPREKFFVNVQKYGNTSAASIGIALDEAVREGKVKSGDNIVLVGFGAGLTWGAGAMKWVY